MNPVEEGLAEYLETIDYAEGPGGKLLNLGTAAEGADTFSDHMPSGPDNAVMFIGTGGAESDSELGYDTPTVQFVVRGTKDPRGAKKRALAIYDALHGLGPVTLPNGVRLISCRGLQSGPVSIGADSNGRYEFSLNFETEIRALTAHRV